MEWEIEGEQLGLHYVLDAQVRGPASADEAITFIAELERSLEAAKPAGVVVHAESLDTSALDVEALALVAAAWRDSELPPEIPSVFVAPDMRTYRALRSLLTLRHAANANVFREAENAHAWLIYAIRRS